MRKSIAPLTTSKLVNQNASKVSTAFLVSADQSEYL